MNGFMTNEGYRPEPVDTSDVQLPPELEALGEAIAKNVHEVWSKNRMNDGWTYGAERNDSLRQHPCLVPYEELPESEKQYDRDTAFETLRLISKLGFRITKTS